MSEEGNQSGVNISRIINKEQSDWEENKFNLVKIYNNYGSCQAQKGNTSEAMFKISQLEWFTWKYNIESGPKSACHGIFDWEYCEELVESSGAIWKNWICCKEG